jgi:Protein kinase domain
MLMFSRGIMIGTTLAQFKISAHLGSGGMGDVYQATDSKLGRSVAIKLLPDAFVRDAGRVARFEGEARILASLNHPDIAAIHGLERVDGRMFLVMEYVPARRWPGGSRKVQSRLRKRWGSPHRFAKRWKPRTTKASFIAI